MTWFRDLSDTLQSLVVLSLAVGVGVAIATATQAYSEIPEMVEDNRSKIESLEYRMQVIEIGQEDILAAIRLSNCLALAERRQEPWQQCIQ